MAGAQIGALNVKLGIDTASFETGLKATQGNLDKVTKSLAIGVSALATTVAAGWTAALAQSKAALEKFGQIADQAKAAGLDSEFFQGFAYSARMAGVDTNTLAGALNTFSKNAGLAAEGKGKLVSQLQVLNPELLRNIQLATDQQGRILAVADAIAAETDASRQAAIATAAFGGEGTKLVAVLEQGSASIQKLIDKARDMGLIVGRDLIARADELGDKFDTASEIIDLKLKQSVINLAPLLLQAANFAADFSGYVAIIADQFNEIENRQYLRPLQNKLAETYNAMQPFKDRIAEIEAALAGGAPNGMVLKLDLADAKAKLAELDALAMQLFERITELQGRPTGNKPGAPPSAPADQNLLPDAGLGLALGDALDVDKPLQFADSVETMSSRTVDAVNRVTGALQRSENAFKSLGGISKLSFQQQVDATLSGLGTITGALAGAFKDNKAFAAADAAVSTAQGVMKAYGQGGLFGFAGAAAIAAAGAIQIASILSAQPGSASVPAAAAPPAGSGAELPGQAINVTFQGRGGMVDDVKRFWNELNETLADQGKQIVVVPT